LSVPDGPLLQLAGVGKQYPGPAGQPPVTVLDGVSFSVTAGETLAIVGPSGSGKTTLLQVIGGLDVPTAGSVRFDGRDVGALDEDQRAALRRKDIGFVFQAHHLLPQCSALENVLVPLLAGPAAERKANPLTPERAEQRARQLLDRVGLGARLAHRPAQLSGGERQRVAVARALLRSPRLLLADEPTGSLDRLAADELGSLLVELNREERTTLIVVTHSAALAERLGRTCELVSGSLRERTPRAA
jgi:lipoprotein-releasing system ATP-binding protein